MIDYILFAVIFVILIIQHFERKELYNRIMAKNLGEYTNYSDKKKEEKYKSLHRQQIDAWRGIKQK